ncbi:MAG: hypothetical protein Tsb009_18120 [Planctomycetaceae bacterium]
MRGKEYYRHLVERGIGRWLFFLIFIVLLSVSYQLHAAERVVVEAPAANDFSAKSLRRFQQGVLKYYGGSSRNVPLDYKARFFEWEIRKYHLAPWNQVHARVILPDEKTGSPNYYYGEDTATWNGALLAAMSYKYAVTRDAKTLQFIGRLIDGLHFYQQVTGRPGLAARCVLQRQAPLADAKHKYVSPDGTVYYVRTDPAKGTYNQIIAGYAAALMHVGDALPRAKRTRLMRDMQALVAHVVRNKYRLIDIDGKPTSYGDVRPLIGHYSIPFNAQVAYMMIATATYFPSPNPQVARRIRREFKRLKTKHHVYYENPLTHLVCPQRVANNPFIKGMNDRNHVMNAAFIGLSLELDSARKMKRKPDKELLYQLGRTMYWGMEAMETHRNALCNFMWAGLLSDPAVFNVMIPWQRDRTRKQIAAVTAMGIEQLRRFPMDRFHYPGRKIATTTPQWVDVRKRHDSYLWKSGPFDRWEITGPPTNTHTASIDFLYAYWVMRYFRLDQKERTRTRVGQNR